MSARSPQPPAVAARLRLAIGLHRQGELVEADRICQEIIAEAPDYFDALQLAAATAAQLGRLAEAAHRFGEALAIDPDDLPTLINRGALLRRLNRPRLALACFDRALAIQPDDPDTQNSRGVVLQRLNRFDEALASYDRALALRPDTPEVLCNRGILLREMGRPEAALASYDRALALRPDYADAQNSRGVVLRELGRADGALASADRALAIRPEFAQALVNRGTTLIEQRRVDEALASFLRAQSIRPDYADAHCGESLCRLLAGDYAAGWAKHEWRWRTEAGAAARREFGQPLWLGEQDLAGKTVLLHAEQGFGDTLQFCRYAPLVAARGASVVLEVQRPLLRLMASLGVGGIVAFGDRLPPFDFHAPLMSLPLAFQTTVKTIPAPDFYLLADPIQVAGWRRRLARLPGRRVGLVWAGLARRDLPWAMAVDRRRSITLDRLAPLAAVPGVSFVSLQKGEPATQARSLPGGMVVHDFTDELADFADTAALVTALDLVICVDTAVAHLAGALGARVWVLNRYDPSWRWPPDRADSPWYKTARLFHQPAPGDWDSEIAEVEGALRAWTAGAIG